MPNEPRVRVGEVGNFSIRNFFLLALGWLLPATLLAQTGFINAAGDTKAGTIESGELLTFQVTLPANYPGLRLVLATAGSGDADLYIQRGATVSTGNYLKAGMGGAGSDTLILTDQELTVPDPNDPNATTTAGTYTIGIYRPTGQTGTLNYTLYYENNWVTDLAWDAGDGANAVMRTLPAQVAQDVYFRISIPSGGANLGAFDTVVSANGGGTAHLYEGTGFVPTATTHNAASVRTGSNGLVLADNQFSASQVWILLVHYVPGATPVTPAIMIRSGEPIVQDIGAVSPTEGANTGDFTVPVEGVSFFRTSVPANLPAWALWARARTIGSSPATYTNVSNTLLVRRLKVPVSVATGSYDLGDSGQMLVVPTYLNANGDTYFVSVTGNPGDVLNLASYAQPVGTMPFNTGSFAVSLPADSFFYKTYLVNVPVQQIAWELDAASGAGNLQFAVRRANIPNPSNNDAFDEPPAGVPASLTLVPPTLSDGVWYVTVYAHAAAAGTLSSGPPVVTDNSFLDQVTNDQSAKSGWRFYRVTDIASQLGNLGWELLLGSPVNGRLLALRRNAVPGQWNCRINGASFNSNYSTSGYIDYQSTIGDLQRPAHQADVWYIGVYLPDAPLGAFTLTTQLLQGVTTGFDAASPPAQNTIANQPAGIWQYFRVDVPAGALGWDVRITNVTGGSPQIVVRRDQLPGDFRTYGWPGSYYGNIPWINATWPSGSQWAAGGDLTGYTYEADGTNASGRILHMGMGNPLEAGTYYIGVSNNGSSGPMSYTLLSRGIGPGYAIPVTNLNFAGGSASAGNLAPRELAYYKVTVPAGQTSWQVKLSAVTGDVALAVQQGCLPNVGAPVNYYGSSTAGSGGVAIQKTGDEHYVLLPTYQNDSNNQPVTTIPAGDYYVAVVSQGGTNVGVPNSTNSQPSIGTGNAGYTVLSRGSVQTAGLGGVEVGTDLTQAGTLEGGEVKFYTFTVPAGLASVQVSLENRTGNPVLSLPSAPGQAGVNASYDDQASGYADLYGWDYAGHGVDTQYGQSFVTLANPAAGTYTVAVRAGINTDSTHPDAGYTIRVHGQATVPVAFDGGSSDVSAQAAGTWQYFRVDVPAGALGWDVRITNVTGGSPQMVVRGGQLPGDFRTYGWPGSYYGNIPWINATWPSGSQWAAGGDLTGYTYEADGTNVSGRILHMGMGNPLEAGTYYIGVSNNGSSGPMSYTLSSRGIGAGYAIPVTNLNFAGGSASASNLAPGELAYYKVTVPAGQTSWQVKLSAVTGDVVLAVQQGCLPNVGAPVNYYGSSTAGSGGVAMQKTGDEHYVLLPTYQPVYIDGAWTPPVTTIPAGDYYVAVVSQGGTNVGVPNSTNSQPSIGTGNAGYTVLSRGSVQTAELGGVEVGTDLTQAGALEGGEVKFYTFTVPEGLASVQVSLENRTGNPVLSLPSAPGQVGMNTSYDDQASWYADLYGWDSTGHGVDTQYGQSFVTLANPAAGTYTVAVRAGINTDNTHPDAGYTIRVHGQATVPVAFDGGSSDVSAQAAGTWQYFRVDVPAGALGWDVRITNVTGGSPQMVVRGGQLPEDFRTYGWPGSYYGNIPWINPTWPSGSQWAAGGDLTGYTYEADGTNASGRILHMGMGNPLEAGTYYIGVSNNGSSGPMSYTLLSRGIGPGYAIPVTNLNFAGGSASAGNLVPRELAYYKVTVPAGQTSWQVKLSAVTGDVALAVQQGCLPNVGAPVNYYGSSTAGGGGVAMRKIGDEHYVLLPTYQNDSNHQPVTTIPAGDYYVTVVSQGGANVGATGNGLAEPRIGTGNAGCTVLSRGSVQTTGLGGVELGTDLTQVGMLEGGEVKFYTFTVPAGLASVQVSLENRTGNPVLSLPSAPGQAGVNASYDDQASWYTDFYGWDYAGHGADTQYGQSFVTLANPAAGTYTVAVRASVNTDNTHPDAGYTIRVHGLLPVVLNFSASQNSGNGGTNTDTRSVGSGQIIYYQVDLPAALNGQPVLGWRVGVALSSGTVDWRVSQTFPPSASSNTLSISASGARILNIAPPLLAAGAWYVQVQGQGSATYTITSEAITLQRPAWTMPAQGQAVTTTGLDPAGAVFADSGSNSDGSPVLDPLTGTVTDQGIDLANGDCHYYAFTVPPGNAGIIRAQLIAISGNPNVYVESGRMPSEDSGASQAERALTASGNTQYGVWPVADSRITGEHPAGTWYVVVKAAGSSNARYRLKLSTGNVFAGGVTQDLALNGGSLSNQILAAGDWRYYRVQIPADAPPASWQVTFTAALGNVDLFIRDTAPPGTSRRQDYAYSIPGNIYDWSWDNKNQGSYDNYPSQGTYTLATPPLRPGATCYLGFHAQTDTVFSVSSVTAGGTLSFADLDFASGTLNAIAIPPNGSVTYRVKVPSTATRWVHTATHDGGVRFYLEQGTSVDLTRLGNGAAHWNSGNGNADTYLNQILGTASDSWPWIADQTYYLTAVNITSAPETFSLQMGFPPPAALAATNVDAVSFIANWVATSQATGYFLQVSTTADFGNLVFTSYVGDSTSYSMTNLSPATAYYYRVLAYGQPGNSDYSSTVSVTTLPFGPPVAQAATLITPTSFVANWAVLAGATGYTLFVSTTADFSGEVSSSNAGDATSDTVTDLTAGTTYYYAVQASGSGTLGTTAGSNVITVSTTAITPFQQWQTSHFGSTTAADAQLTADPDHDGISNLLEYAFGSDPLVTSSSRPVPAVATNLADGKPHLTLTAKLNTAATDLTVVAEVSSDLATWNSGSAYTEVVSDTTTGGVRTLVLRDKTPLTAGSRRFMRLRVDEVLME